MKHLFSIRNVSRRWQWFICLSKTGRLPLGYCKLSIVFFKLLGHTCIPQKCTEWFRLVARGHFIIHLQICCTFSLIYSFWYHNEPKGESVLLKNWPPSLPYLCQIHIGLFSNKCYYHVIQDTGHHKLPNM